MSKSTIIPTEDAIAELDRPNLGSWVIDTTSMFMAAVGLDLQTNLASLFELIAQALLREIDNEVSTNGLSVDEAMRKLDADGGLDEFAIRFTRAYEIALEIGNDGDDELIDGDPFSDEEELPVIGIDWVEAARCLQMAAVAFVEARYNGYNYGAGEILELVVKMQESLARAKPINGRINVPSTALGCVFDALLKTAEIAVSDRIAAPGMLPEDFSGLLIDAALKYEQTLMEAGWDIGIPPTVYDDDDDSSEGNW